MKKLFFLLLMLLLFISILTPLAEESLPFSLKEEGLFLVQNQNNEESPFFLLDVTFQDDLFYLLTNKQLFSYNDTTKEILPLASTTSPKNPNSSLINHLFFWENTLYGLNLYEGHIYPFSPDKKYIKEEVLLLPKELMTPLEEEGYSLHFQGVFNNILYLLFDYTPLGGDFNAYQGELRSYHLTTQKVTLYNTPSIAGLFEGNQGEILAYTYSPKKEGSLTYQVGSFNSLEDSFTSLHTLSPKGPLKGMAYHNQQFYYLVNQGLYSFQKGEEPVILSYFSQSPEGKILLNSEGNRCFILLREAGLGFSSALPLQNQGKALVLPPMNPWDEPLVASFSMAHPTVHLVQNQWAYQENTLLQRLLLQSVSSDVLLENLFTISFGPIKEKAYAYPLSQSSFIKEKFSTLHPFLQEALSYEGEMYAFPLRLRLSFPSYYPKVMKDLGLTEKDMPTTYTQYLQFFLRWQKELRDAHPEYSLCTYGIDRYSLLVDVTNMYINAYLSPHHPLTFNTPLFKELISLIDQIDFTDSTLYNADFSATDEVALFGDYSFGSSAYHYNKQFMPLSFEDNGPILLSPFSQIEILFINPYSQNSEDALAFVEHALSQIEPVQLPFLFSNELKPVEDPSYQENLSLNQGTLDHLKNLLQEAKEEDKAFYTEQVATYTKELETYKEKEQWIVSEETLQNYQNLLPRLKLPTDVETIYAGGENSVYTLVHRYINDEISLEDFITQADQKLHILFLEQQ